jgi:hypothetical protein
MRWQSFSKECLCEPTGSVLFDLLLWATSHCVWRIISTVQITLVFDKLFNWENIAIKWGGTKDIPIALQRQKVCDCKEFDGRARVFKRFRLEREVHEPVGVHDILIQDKFLSFHKQKAWVVRVQLCASLAGLPETPTFILLLHREMSECDRWWHLGWVCRFSWMPIFAFVSWIAI